MKKILLLSLVLAVSIDMTEAMKRDRTDDEDLIEKVQQFTPSSKRKQAIKAGQILSRINPKIKKLLMKCGCNPPPEGYKNEFSALYMLCDVVETDPEMDDILGKMVSEIIECHQYNVSIYWEKLEELLLKSKPDVDAGKQPARKVAKR